MRTEKSVLFNLHLVLALTITEVYSDPNLEQSSRLSLETPNGCLLPPHPLFGEWKIVNPISQTYEVPEHTILKVHCDETYKLDGCALSACIQGKWFPPLGHCLKTCPSIHSTSILKVTCSYKGFESENCTEPLEGTLVTFKCASFYEDSRVTQPKALCNEGKWSDRVPDCTPICGRASVQKRPTLVIRGDRVKKGQFPWQTAIYQASDKNLICGGTLLSERVVLTAAHCVTDRDLSVFPKETFIVVVGKYYREFEHPNERNYIQRSELHDLFVPNTYEGPDQNYLGDIAVLVTKKSFKFSTRVQPVCIDWSKQYEDVAVNSGTKKGFVSGWGYTKESSDPSPELKSLQVPSIPVKKCKSVLPDLYRRYLTHDKFCAGYKDNGTSVCRGDSGGGLVFKHRSRFFIAGVVSLAPLADTTEGGCDSQQYGLYTLVYRYTDSFILDKIATFKGTDTNSDKCKGHCDESTTTTSTTEAPVPPSPPPEPSSTTTVIPNSCRFPNHPKNGQFHVTGGAFNTSPGMSLPPFTVITVTCDKGFKYVGEKYIFCQEEKWVGKTGECLRTCTSPGVSSNTQVSCTLNETSLPNCTEPLHGTILKFRCAPFYESSSLDVKPRICLDGSWDYPMPKCQPVTGEKGKNQIISGGGEISPWHVTVYKEKRFQCFGTLIATKLVLTAAHCLTNLEGALPKSKDFEVAVGARYPLYNSPRDQAQLSVVKEIKVHPNYRGVLSPDQTGDIAIIILEKSLTLSSEVLPVSIDWRHALDGRTNSSQAWMSGLDNQAGTPRQDRYVEKGLFLNSTDECFDIDLPSINFVDKKCASFFNYQAACKGESGAGITVLDRATGKFYLVGVLTNLASKEEAQGQEDCIFKNVFYVDVPQYVDGFILKEIVTHGDDI